MKTLTIAVFAASLLAGTAAGGVEFNSNWPVRGKRMININTVVRVNQIEVSRDCNRYKSMRFVLATSGSTEANLVPLVVSEPYRTLKQATTIYIR
ncbi:MAG: hypothetical protein IJI54_11140 [Kiritimatiellae bacterium]|nr:hypothetical protein [Kiritimatiellia bacterium]